MNPDGEVPREKIPWYPSIDGASCTNCDTCIEFCRHGVYVKENGVTKVEAPNNCIVGCSACESECPEHAISFPVMEEFMMALGELRLQYDKKEE